MNISPTHDALVAAMTDALAKAGVRSPPAPAAPAIPPSDLFKVWLAADREKPPVERYQRDARALFQRLEKFLAAQTAAPCDLRAVSRQDARAFLKVEFERGISPKTYNNHLILLRSAFTEVCSGTTVVNPFVGLKSKKTDMVGRDCFSEEELERILAEAAKDDFIGAPVVTAAMTAMRRGDCCLLQVRALDLERRMIRVKTRKTGKYVWIPMFPLLHETLTAALADRITTPRDYVFPDVAKMYRQNPDGITWRFVQLLKRAGVMTDEDIAPPEETGQRLRQPSRRGWHAFRTTWTTLALNYDVSESMVLDVTGIRTLQVARQHYYKPGIEQFDSVLTARLPSVLKTGTKKLPGKKDPKVA